MKEITKGYLWYKFRFYLDENKLEILDNDYKLIKTINLKPDSNLEKILDKNNFEMVELFKKILKENLR